MCGEAAERKVNFKKKQEAYLPPWTLCLLIGHEFKPPFASAVSPVNRFLLQNTVKPSCELHCLTHCMNQEEPVEQLFNAHSLWLTWNTTFQVLLQKVTVEAASVRANHIWVQSSGFNAANIIPAVRLFTKDSASCLLRTIDGKRGGRLLKSHKVYFFACRVWKCI